MDTETALRTATDLLKPWTVQTATPEPNRLDVVIKAADLPKAADALKKSAWGYVTAITGLDHPAPAPAAPLPDAESAPAEPAPEGNIEVLYHLCNGAAILTLRVSLPYSAASVPSICKWFPTATLYERELIEMFGISIPGTPNTDRLLLPEDWPDDVYPLRKSFHGPAATEQA